MTRIVSVFLGNSGIKNMVSEDRKNATVLNIKYRDFRFMFYILSILKYEKIGRQECNDCNAYGNNNNSFHQNIFNNS